MGEALTAAEHGPNLMHKRRTRLEDGRYLIYYTFGEGREGEDVSAGGGAPPAPVAENESGEERSV